MVLTFVQIYKNKRKVEIFIEMKLIYDREMELK